jgi:hypothetical protein
MRLISTRTVGNDLAYFTYELARDADIATPTEG